MNDLLHNLIESLREELKQYGEMLALMDQQQTLVMRRQTGELFQNVAGVNAQAEVIAAARREREQFQRNLARELQLQEDAGFNVLIPLLPADYRPLVQALVDENNELLARVQQRARQNHLILSHAVELMQQMINSMFPGAGPKTYDDAGRLPASSLPQHSLYEAVG
jgi:flagellar biosynthesis/type III secretory pathway chaperone